MQITPEHLITGRYKLYFTDKVQIPTTEPFISLEGLKMWHTKLGVVCHTHNFRNIVGKLLIYYNKERKCTPEPVCVIAYWKDIKQYTAQLRANRLFEVCGNQSRLTMRIVSERLANRLKIAHTLKLELLSKNAPEKYILGGLARAMWAQSDCDCWYDDDSYLYLLCKEAGKYTYKPFMKSDELQTLVSLAMSRKDNESIVNFLTWAKKTRLIDESVRTWGV